MVQTVFLGNARTRRAFSGVAAFYQALQAGKQAKEGNPIFYVSSSPWNLYDLLSDFFALNGIPAGPILLRDWGITEEEVLPTGHRSYKLKWIHSLLNTFSNLPFILIGDNSQEDPEIYRELVRLYPGRILAIYIRNITRQIERSAEVNKLAEEMTGQGTPFLPMIASRRIGPKRRLSTLAGCVPMTEISPAAVTLSTRLISVPYSG
jgi:phosphatidate phosphatase APP1